MITDQDVIDLYRCLLNRAPESDDTIKAFRAYYPDFFAGRRAVLASAEFARLYAGEESGPAPLLAQAALRAARPTPPADATAPLARTLRDLFARHGAIKLAVVLGTPAIPLEAMLPLQDGTACILHADPYFSTACPGLRPFPGARALLTTGADAETTACLVRDTGLSIDVLILASPNPDPAALLPHLSGKSILLSTDPFPPQATALHAAERVLHINTMHILQIGGWFLPVEYRPAPAAPLPSDAPRLAIAAIVRNEQTALPNMLTSAAPIAHSFVVLDTGSTDETMPNAQNTLESLGKPFVLAHSTAQRFDDMRNEALSLVPPEADWILMLDADEELVPEDHAPLLALLREATQHAYALPRYNFLGPDKTGEVAPYPDRQVRLLRNGPNRPSYEGAVHETVRHAKIGLLPLNAEALGQGTGGPHIHHLVRRFKSAEAEAAKQAHYRHIAAAFG